MAREQGTLNWEQEESFGRFYFSLHTFKFLCSPTYLSDGFSSFTTRPTTASRTDQIIINMMKVDTSATLDSDNY